MFNLYNLQADSTSTDSTAKEIIQVKISRRLKWVRQNRKSFLSFKRRDFGRLLGKADSSWTENNNRKSVWIFHQSFHNSSLCWCFPGHKRRIHLNDSIPTEQIKQLNPSSQSTLYDIVSCLSVNYVLYLYLLDCVRGHENYPPLIMDILDEVFMMELTSDELFFYCVFMENRSDGKNYVFISHTII